MLKINLIHNFLRVLVLSNKKLDNRVWIMSGAIKYKKICIHETLNIKIYFLASGKPCLAAMSSGVNDSKFE